MKKNTRVLVLALMSIVTLLSVAQTYPVAMTADTNGELVGAYISGAGFAVKRGEQSDQTALTAFTTSHSLHLSTLTTNGEGIFMVTGWFQGTLSWDGGQLTVGSKRQGFAATFDTQGLLANPVLLPRDLGLPVSAGAAGSGLFHILFQQADQSVSRLVLDETAQMIDDGGMLRWTGVEHVEQPEDMMEDPGGQASRTRTTTTTTTTGTTILVTPETTTTFVEQPEDMMEDPGGN